MNETSINMYLDSVIAENPSDPLITGYAYTSVDLHAITKNDVGITNFLRDASDYTKIETKMVGVPRNYMSVLNPDFYVPQSI